MQKRLKSVFICVFSILLMIFNGCVFVNKVDTTYELEYKKNKSFFENFKESWFSSTSEFLFLNKDTLSDDEVFGDLLKMSSRSKNDAGDDDIGNKTVTLDAFDVCVFQGTN